MGLVSVKELGEPGRLPCPSAFCHVIRQQGAILKAETGPSPDTEPASTLILDFQLTELRNKFLSFIHFLLSDVLLL
jgi:hypothetical protein